MASGLIDIMKRAALDANQAEGYVDLKYGTVSSINPLTIRITPSFVLPKDVLVVPEYLTNHEVQVSVNWTSGVANEHSHGISGTKTMTINNGLKVNDRVVLIKEHGGGRYLVIDRY